jgi:KaiC/GvpD/RAD55 family RecA-like ATPase
MTSTPLYPLRDALVTQSAGLRGAVDFCVALDRSIWNDSTRYAEIFTAARLATHVRAAATAVSFPEELADRVSAYLQAYFQIKVRHEQTAAPGSDPSKDKRELRDHLLSGPEHLGKALLGHDHLPEIRYFVRSRLRRDHSQYSPDSVILPFRAIADALHGKIEKRRGRRARSFPLDAYLGLAQTVLEPLTGHNDEWIPYADLFLHCCRGAAYIVPRLNHIADRRQELFFNTPRFDIEFLVSHLFGMPTHIAGFDVLFGGGGLLLAERGPALQLSPIGRSMLIKGRFGSGKTICALQLCAEIARKGGIARFVGLEQSARECQYILASLNLLKNARDVRVLSDPDTLAGAINDRRASAPRVPGLIGLIEGVKDSIPEFLSSLLEDAASAEAASLSLLAVDPINAVVHRPDSADAAHVRSVFLSAIERIKGRGTNVLFVAEENTSRSDELAYIENVVDTVIHLSEQHTHGFTRRHVEVQKSRQQRENRGLHVYEINPGEGIHIYPSSVAIAARINHRRVTMPGPATVTRFGLREVDDILGEAALYRGDVIAFRGATGSYKTELGITFLLNADRIITDAEPQDATPVSLLVAARDTKESLQHKLNSEWVQYYYRAETPRGNKPREGGIVLCPLPLGNVHPGLVFQELEREFAAAAERGERIDRVMVTNIAHWDLSCQYIKEDRTFADTLVGFMRRMNVTTVFVCGEDAGVVSADIQRPILDHADVVFEFERFDFHGERRVTLRATKSRSMGHSKQRYEIGVGEEGLFVRPTGGLLRAGAAGESRLVPLRLFVNSETRAQARYNERWEAILKGVVSEDAVIQTESTMHIVTDDALSRHSAVDELQIYQIDEFQAPRDYALGKRKEWTTPLPENLLGADGGGPLDFIPEVSGGLRTSAHTLRASSSTTGRCYAAVPYYADVGFLACRPEAPAEVDSIGSWDALCGLQSTWYRDRGDDTLFFALPLDNAENLNCLFFEILFEALEKEGMADGYGVNGQLVASRDMCRLLSGNAAIRAASIFHELAHRCYRQWRARGGRSGRQGSGAAYFSRPSLQVEALVSRQWYSSLHDAVRNQAGDLASLRTRLLPSERSVAGDWFLCIPKHSAGVETAVEIIRQMTVPAQEVARLAQGVGLPTREEFYVSRLSYRRKREGGAVEEGHYEAGILVGGSVIRRDAILLQIRRALRRSSFAGYARWTRALSATLEKMLELELAKSEWESAAADCLGAACFNIRYAAAD